jgi:TonB family protein
VSDRKGLPLACMLVLCGAGIAAAAQGPAPAPPASAPQARTALAFNPLRRCPDLRIASEDDPEFAVVIFLVGPSGVSSHPSLLSPSNSRELDAAAMGCVLKLRFQPATRLGDGTPVESWQQIRWKWATAGHAPAASAASQAPPVPPSAGSDDGDRRPASPTANRAEVRVCVDAQGRLTGEPKLTRASGDAQFDAAALQVAKSGSGLYRTVGGDGKTAAGCLQLAIAASGP